MRGPFEGLSSCRNGHPFREADGRRRGTATTFGELLDKVVVTYVPTLSPGAQQTFKNYAKYREEDVYGGVRVKMPAELDRARTILSLDVSIGDPVAPPPVTVTYPTLLEGEPFDLVAYPMVTVLAEKVETMIRRGQPTPGRATSPTCGC